MTAPVRVKEADMMRAVRTAKKLGAKRVRIEPDGSIDIVLEEIWRTSGYLSPILSRRSRKSKRSGEHAATAQAPSDEGNQPPRDGRLVLP